MPGIGRGGRTGGMGSGGTPYNPKQKIPKPKRPADPYVMPPFLSFDPAIEAQRRAAQRGLEDLEEDTKTGRHFAQTDLTQALKDIRTNTSRKRGDINRDSFRANRKFDYEEQDLGKRAGRNREDFGTQLANIGRQFAQLGHRQAQSANAAGVYDQGTMAAGHAARSANKALAEAPIHTAASRMEEDLATALGRLATGRGDLAQDTDRALTHLNQDRNRSRKLTKRETGRKLFDLTRKLGRGRREAAITDIDLLTEEIYVARAEHPAIFKQWKKENPDIFALIGAPGAAPKPKGPSGGPSITKSFQRGGIGPARSTPPRRRRGGR